MKTVEVDFKNASASSFGDEEASIYNKLEILSKLHANLPTAKNFVADKIVGSSKYVKLANTYGYNNYRFCMVQDLINIGVYGSFSERQKRFLVCNGAFIVILNELADAKVVSAIFRSVEGKEFMDYSTIFGPYGLNLFSTDFKYGDAVVLTEGVYDADVLRPLYPNVLSMLSSNISVMQLEILKTLTNNFIVLFDSDKAGDSGYKLAKSKLPNVQRIDVYKGDKDVGQMEEFKNANNIYEYTERKEYYSKQLEMSLASIICGNAFSL